MRLRHFSLAFLLLSTAALADDVVGYLDPPPASLQMTTAEIKILKGVKIVSTQVARDFVARGMTSVTLFTRAEAAEPSPAPSGVPVVVAPPAPPSAGTPINVPVAEPAAPPEWAQTLIVTAGAIPLLGPLVQKGLLYLGILSGILTSLVAFVLGSLSLLKGSLNIAGLDKAATAVEAFRDGPVMYYLKFFSNFNAQKPGASAAKAKA